MQLDKIITTEDKQMRIPWWGLLCIFIAAIPLLFLFDHFGKSTLARPTLYSVAMVAIAVAMRWKLRRHAWFWITITLFTTLHVLLILFVPWGTKWVPAIVITPIGIADLYAMLAILSVVAKLAGNSRSDGRDETRGRNSETDGTFPR